MLVSVSSTRPAASADPTSMTSDPSEFDPPVSARRRITPLGRWGAIVASVVVVLVADQLSKSWALGRLGAGEIIEVLPTLNLRLTFNTGMAFSKGSTAGPLIGIVAIVIAGVLLFVSRRITSTLQLVLIGVVIGGALGNVIDRLTRVGEVGATGTGFMSGAVVDFIAVSWWAVFNIADAAIVVGGLALALTGLRTDSDSPEQPDSPEQQDSPEQPDTAVSRGNSPSESDE